MQVHSRSFGAPSQSSRGTPGPPPLKPGSRCGPGACPRPQGQAPLQVALDRGQVPLEPAAQRIPCRDAKHGHTPGTDGCEDRQCTGPAMPLYMSPSTAVSLCKYPYQGRSPGCQPRTGAGHHGRRSLRPEPRVHRHLRHAAQAQGRHPVQEVDRPWPLSQVTQRAGSELVATGSPSSSRANCGWVRKSVAAAGTPRPPSRPQSGTAAGAPAWPRTRPPGRWPPGPADRSTAGPRPPSAPSAGACPWYPLVHHFVSSADLGELGQDGVGLDLPPGRRGPAVVAPHVAAQGGLQVGHIVEGAAVHDLAL